MLDFERSIWLKILSSQSALWKLYVGNFWVAEIPSSPIDIPQAFYIRATSDVPIQMSKKRNRTEQKIHAHKSEKIRLSRSTKVEILQRNRVNFNLE